MYETEPKHILCYGDSNTFGTDPTHRSVRHPWGVRWPGRLQTLLGEGWRIIEEGLGGRTTAWDHPLEPGRNGLAYLPTALHSHRPLDLVILSLGTNDCKSIFNASPRFIAQSAGALIDAVQRYPYGPGVRPPKVLLLSPIYMGPDIASSEYPDFDQTSGEKVRALARWYAAIAEQRGCTFLDAAQFAGPGPDQLHMDAEGHRALAGALAPVVRGLV